jgi:hypothetical protein
MGFKGVENLILITRRISDIRSPALDISNAKRTARKFNTLQTIEINAFCCESFIIGTTWG